MATKKKVKEDGRSRRAEYDAAVRGIRSLIKDGILGVRDGKRLRDEWYSWLRGSGEKPNSEPNS